MSNVLVCIKRVPDLGGEITLTADAMAVDDTSLGHTVSARTRTAPSSWPSRPPRTPAVRPP